MVVFLFHSHHFKSFFDFSVFFLRFKIAQLLWRCQRKKICKKNEKKFKTITKTLHWGEKEKT